MLLPDHLLAKARDLFPHTSQRKIYLNHAATAPLSTRVVNAMTASLRERSEGKLETLDLDLPMVGECRKFVQKLMNAESPHRIAMLGNTTDAINIVAAGIPWKSGDRVLLSNIEFPANVWPYLNLKRLGVEIDIIQSADGKVTTELIVDGITPRTRLVALSAVQFLSGYRADMAAIGEICRNRGIIFAVDGIQAVGAVRVDVQQMKIDALAAGAQKWQMSPHGSGFLYLTEDLQSRIQQKSVGWLSVAEPWDFYNFDQPLASNARRYEGGTLNFPSLWGMHAALSMLLEYGTDDIEGHILSLTQQLIDGLNCIEGIRLFTPTESHERAGIVTVEFAENVDEKNVFASLAEQNITVALREKKLRFSPHFYNSPEEMAIVLEATKKLLLRSQM
jgi:selenocysteine lyase/cysteine desulfurase